MLKVSSCFAVQAKAGEGSRMEAAHNVELMRLLDFYGAMLTDRQHEMLRLRLEEDLSLSEIAEGFSVSRQAVNDALRKAEKTLTETEQKLRLVEKYRALHRMAGQAARALDGGDAAGARRILEKMLKEGV